MYKISKSIVRARVAAFASIAISLATSLTPTSTFAAIVTQGCAQASNHTCTLHELFDGAIVFVDETAFWKWEFRDKDDGLSGVDNRAVNVTFSETGRGINLAFTSDQFYANPDEGNFQFKYEVATKAGVTADKILKFGLSLTGYDIRGSGSGDVRVGVGFVDETPLLGPPWIVGAFQFNEKGESLYASSSFSPLDNFIVSTRISLSGSPPVGPLDAGTYAEVTAFTESFYRIPEPSTTSLVMFAGALLISMRRRQSAK
jgi:hypothetical protein